jgi:multidrug efflux pump subunit AcrA (membrane-fusion protein)
MSRKKSKPIYSKYKRKQNRNWLPVGLIVGGVALLALAIFAFRPRPPAPKAAIEVTGAPSLKVDQEEVNLGDIKLGRTVSVSFQLINVGDKPLRFSKTPYIEVLEGC